jgi:hypothetical protein
MIVIKRAGSGPATIGNGNCLETHDACVPFANAGLGGEPRFEAFGVWGARVPFEKRGFG